MRAADDAAESQPANARAWRTAVRVLLLIAAVRLVTLPFPALTDTTEGRYAAAALHMLQSGDWLMPQVPLDHGYEPYFGKPPLQSWLMAASMRAFGANALAARLPSLLMAMLLVGSVAGYARRRFGDLIGGSSGLLLASTLLCFALAGLVNVDMTLAAMVTLAVIASCRVAEGGPRWWGYVFFASIGLGCLDKGPIAIALPGLVGVFHLLVYRNRRAVTGLPWLGGPLLFLLITVPWFFVAERQHPGFLRYFFVNENLGRFVAHDYGDRYGAGRTRLPLSIWLWLLGGALPWTLLLPGALLRRAGRHRARAALGRDGAFMLLWGVAPAVAFSMSPQFTPDYLLPGCGGLAVAAAMLVHAPGGDGRLVRAVGRAGVGLLCVAAAMWVVAMVLEARGSDPIFARMTSEGGGWFGEALAAVALCLPAGGLAAAAAVPLWRRLRAGPQAPVAPASMAWALALAATAIAASPYVSANHSAWAVLGQELQGQPVLGVAERHAYTVWFYAPALTGGVTRVEYLGLDQLSDTPLVDVLVRASHLGKLPEAAQQRFHVLARTGGWVWLTQGPPPARGR